MDNIKFEITENDIKDYLETYKKDENIRYREAMFVKYMRETGIFTKESLEILIEKYNLFRIINATGIYDDSYGIMENPCYHLSSFSNYLQHLKLDISGACHIMVPTIKYYGLNVEWYQFEDKTIQKEFAIALENYRIAGKISIVNDIPIICMPNDDCEKELYEYEKIYGDVKVKQIRKIIKEGVR